MRKLIIYLLIIALTHSLTEGACTERTDTTSVDQLKSNQSESLSSSVGNFFTDVGCSIKSGAKTVKERVQSGYQFLKHKISDSDSAPEIKATDNSSGQLDDLNSLPKIPLAPEEFRYSDSVRNVPLAREDDRIIFDGPTEIATHQSQSIIPTTPSGFSLDDRIALTAPTICREGERLDNGICRKKSKF